MNDNWIFAPILAQVALTAVVWCIMYWQRLSYIQREGIDPQDLATDSTAKRRLAAVEAPSDNFSNQFETPVLFYVAGLTAYVTDTVEPVLLGLSIAFVALRVLHAGIHVTYNDVMHRFAAYVAATGVLWALWLMLGLRLAGRA